MSTLQHLYKTLWRHTPKAVRKGHPADRVFVVTGVGKDEGGFYLRAWKCIAKPDGTIDHPALGIVPLTDERIWIETSTNGSSPTAAFVPDSFYTQL